MPSLRLFIAIEIPPDIKSQLAVVISELKSAQADVRWERPEKLHITLKFLGDTPEDLLPQIVLLLEGVAGKISSFTLRYSGLGCFPDKREPRIVWVGVEDIGNRLQPLAAVIEKEMTSIGLEKEKKEFHPHVTVGRVKSQKNIPSLLRKMESTTLESQPTEVSHIVLIKSELKSSGSVYTAVRKFPFYRIISISNEMS